jgi:hypothetical protein
MALRRLQLDHGGLRIQTSIYTKNTVQTVITTVQVRVFVISLHSAL